MEENEEEVVPVEETQTEEAVVSEEPADEDSVNQSSSYTANDIINNFKPEIVEDNEYQSRFKGANWFDCARSKSIMCIGVGGIGSHTAFLMSRFNPSKIAVVDMDLVDASNISGQLYSVDQVGDHKVFAIESNIKKFSDYHNVVAVNGNIYDVTLDGYDIYILGLDSITTRSNMVESLRMMNRNNVWVIDGRLSMDTLQVFCFRISDHDSYSTYTRKFIFKEEEADQTVCSLKQTSFMANMIASFICNLYTSICMQETSVFPYNVPFLIEYDCKTYNLKVYVNHVDAAKQRSVEK